MGAHVWQSLLVAAIVTAAAVYAVWSLVPGTTRLRWARRLGSWGRAAGRAAWIARLTVDIERRAAARAGGCAGCGSGQPAEPREQEPPH
jgi:hypothetical protein